MFFTERLCLRGFQNEDKDKIANMMMDPPIVSTQPSTPVIGSLQNPTLAMVLSKICI